MIKINNAEIIKFSTNTFLNARKKILELSELNDSFTILNESSFEIVDYTGSEEMIFIKMEETITINGVLYNTEDLSKFYYPLVLKDTSENLYIRRSKLESSEFYFNSTTFDEKLESILPEASVENLTLLTIVFDNDIYIVSIGIENSYFKAEVEGFNTFNYNGSLDLLIKTNSIGNPFKRISKFPFNTYDNVELTTNKISLSSLNFIFELNPNYDIFYHFLFEYIDKFDYLRSIEKDFNLTENSLSISIALLNEELIEFSSENLTKLVLDKNMNNVVLAMKINFSEEVSMPEIDILERIGRTFFLTENFQYYYIKSSYLEKHTFNSGYISDFSEMSQEEEDLMSKIFFEERV